MRFFDRFSKRFYEKQQRDKREAVVGPKGPELIAVDEALVFNLGPATHRRGQSKLSRYPGDSVTARQRRERNRKRTAMRSLVRRRLPHGRTVKPYRG